MISTRVNLAAVGLFVLVALGSLLVALAILAGRAGPRDEYHTVFGNVAGLKYGSQVLYEGYPIGQVEGIEPLREKGRLRFRVNLTVAAGWDIPEDSLARSEASGLLAPQTVEISAGRSANMLQPGAMIPSADPQGLFSSLTSVAGNVDEITGTALIPLLLNLNRKVDTLGEVIDKDLRPLLGDARGAVAGVTARLPAILANVDRAAANLAGASQGVGAVFTPERLARLDRMLTEAEGAMASLRQSSEELQRVVQAGGPELAAGLREFRETTAALSRHAEPFAQNLDLTARNLQDFSRQLRGNPALLLRAGERPDDPVPPYRRTDPE